VHNGKRNIAAVVVSLWEGQSLRLFGTRVLRLSQDDGHGKIACEIDSVICALRKKPGGKLNSPPGLKLGVVIPKAFGIVIKRRALMPLFLR
jgi:hypothetical protein